ncbi:hypothetical protein ACE6ED_13280 [Paenibacillus sp. CN-4]|uniref:hypothetical protein n=1 Tax=Paenibacillus nanchangensis TaxID=3348343 RepID=UPI00397BB863
MNIFDSLDKQIASSSDYIAEIQRMNQALGIPDFLTKLEINSVEMRITDLERVREEECINNEFEELEVTLYPEDLPSGEVSVRSLVAVLGGVQSLTDNVANTLFNQRSNRGPIPQEIIDRNTWVLKAVKAGSFIAVIELENNKQLTFEEPPQRQIINELFNLLYASDEEESLLEAASYLGKRTLSHYTDWAKSIKELGIPINLNWTTSGSPKKATVQLDPEKAERIFTILTDKLESSEEEITTTGKLTAVNVRTGSFEFMPYEGEIFTGRIPKFLIPKAAKHLDNQCTLEVLKVTARSTAGKESVSWTLKEIMES